MKRHPIFVFTPSNTDPEVLERIFVQRHRLLEKIVDRLKRSMLTGDKHHVLLIGPRGSGKTNMVTLAHHRLTQQTELHDAMRIAWLGEDDTITGLIDLALGIADRLAGANPNEFDVDYRALFRGLSPDDAAEAILSEIHRRLQHRYLLLIVENLDAAFKGLGDQGQKRWRAFLQEKGRVATLATAQQIFDAVSDRDFPFWGFFDIHHLAPLSFEDARILIRNISVENENHGLVQFLDTADGRYRIRSLHHLAGGNHRMYVLLSEFLTKESLDDLVTAFETLADELTPYFQERLRSLPAQQAKIVQCLAAATGATTVKEIAALTFIDERSCSKQLGELRNKRYVQSEKRGKESYYELSEPLMRLCLEVKNQRGKPLQLIARFLKVWFSPDALQTQLKLSSGSGNRADAYRASALNLDNQFQIPVREQIDREFEKHLNEKNYAAALEVAEELQYVDKLLGVWKAARVKFDSGDFAGALADCTSVIEMDNASVDQKAKALVYRGVIQFHSEQMLEALASYQSAVRIAQQDSESMCRAMFALPEPLVEVGLLDDVSTALRHAFEENNHDCEAYAGTPNVLFWMVLRRGSRDWNKYVSTLIPMYVEFGVADKLARGLTQLIKRLDEGDFSHGQLDEWNAVWQKHGAGIDELEIALQCVAAATEAIKTKSDRSLFRLPQEVRSLVRSLLDHTLGPDSER
ncbi:MAG: hypothetical protein KDB01_08790 [Planctomycetaceae bacterium]|nr:hypothetical protein [Planctomycetaceae bacterium]